MTSAHVGIILKIVGFLIVAYIVNDGIDSWTGLDDLRDDAQAAEDRAEALQDSADGANDLVQVFRDSLTQIDRDAVTERAVADAEIAVSLRQASQAQRNARALADSIQTLISPEAQLIFGAHLVQDSIAFAAKDTISAQKDVVIEIQLGQLTARNAFISQLEPALVLSQAEADAWEASSIGWERVAKPPLFTKLLKGLPWLGAGAAITCLFICGG